MAFSCIKMKQNKEQNKPRKKNQGRQNAKRNLEMDACSNALHYNTCKKDVLYGMAQTFFSCFFFPSKTSNNKVHTPDIKMCLQWSDHICWMNTWDMSIEIKSITQCRYSSIRDTFLLSSMAAAFLRSIANSNYHYIVCTVSCAGKYIMSPLYQT